MVEVMVWHKDDHPGPREECQQQPGPGVRLPHILVDLEETYTTENIAKG